MSGPSKIDLDPSDAREVAAAAGAVVVGGDDELLRRVDRLAVELQVDDAAARPGSSSLALGVVLRRLGDVDLVGHAVDDVEIVGREVGLISGWSALPGVDLVEDAGRASPAIP